nr:hypothetical protein [Tanacetum cinerariifolium]
MYYATIHTLFIQQPPPLQQQFKHPQQNPPQFYSPQQTQPPPQQQTEQASQETRKEKTRKKETDMRKKPTTATIVSGLAKVKTRWLKVLNEFNKSALQKRTKDMLMGKWKMLNGSSFCDETKEKVFSTDGPWEILRKHPMWDANDLIDPVDEIGHTELFEDDARPPHKILESIQNEFRLKREATDSRDVRDDDQGKRRDNNEVERNKGKKNCNDLGNCNVDTSCSVS